MVPPVVGEWVTGVTGHQEKLKRRVLPQRRRTGDTGRESGFTGPDKEFILRGEFGVSPDPTKKKERNREIKGTG